jgi:hypothetical protein
MQKRVQVSNGEKINIYFDLYVQPGAYGDCLHDEPPPLVFLFFFPISYLPMKVPQN